MAHFCPSFRSRRRACGTRSLAVSSSVVLSFGWRSALCSSALRPAHRPQFDDSAGGGIPFGAGRPRRTTCAIYTHTTTSTPTQTLPAASATLQTTFSIGLGTAKPMLRKRGPQVRKHGVAVFGQARVRAKGGGGTWRGVGGGGGHSITCPVMGTAYMRPHSLVRRLRLACGPRPSRAQVGLRPTPACPCGRGRGDRRTRPWDQAEPSLKNIVGLSMKRSTSHPSAPAINAIWKWGGEAGG